MAKETQVTVPNVPGAESTAARKGAEELGLCVREVETAPVEYQVGLGAGITYQVTERARTVIAVRGGDPRLRNLRTAVDGTRR
ncbi:hypothetical protein [Spirillospora sp. CA-128828]|uniref:hypothetical protein n=1 Tax=Spirillospora sp. CA-128828 TaxID=3240033 RepID=UPI003D93EB14